MSFTVINFHGTGAGDEIRARQHKNEKHFTIIAEDNERHIEVNLHPTKTQILQIFNELNCYLADQPESIGAIYVMPEEKIGG